SSKNFMVELFRYIGLVSRKMKMVSTSTKFTDIKHIEFYFAQIRCIPISIKTKGCIFQFGHFRKAIIIGIKRFSITIVGIKTNSFIEFIIHDTSVYVKSFIRNIKIDKRVIRSDFKAVFYWVFCNNIYGSCNGTSTVKS